MATPMPVHQQFTNEQKIDITNLFYVGKSQEEIANLYCKPRRTIGKLLIHLGLRRTASEVGKLSIESPWEHLVDRVRELRPTHSLPQIVALLGIPQSSLARLCERHSIPVPDDYSDLQSQRMKAAWTDEQKAEAAKIALSRVTPELREKLAEGSRKLWDNQEYRAKQVTSQKIVWADVELRQRMSAVLTEYWDSAERREVMAAVQQLVWTDDKKAEMSEIQKKIWADPEKRRKISELMRIVWANPVLRNVNSERVKKVWQDDNFRARMAVARSSQPRVSSLQDILYGILDDLNIVYYREYENRPADNECVIGPYNFDCVIPRSGRKSLLIECHGDYWHSLDKAIRVDKAKATYVERYHSHEYELHYLWEHEFSCQDKIIETIKYWLGINELEVLDFDFTNLKIKPTPAMHYRNLLSKYHYLANAGRGGVAYGAYLDDVLIAVCVFSPLVRQNIDTLEFGHKECVELSRLCIHPRYQKKNLASWFVSRCMKQLGDKIKMVISYCDTTFNHDGAVYKSLNFKQDKVVRPDYWYVNENGWVMHKKTLYGKAVKMSMIESEYAERFGYKKVFGTEKLRFVFER